MNSGNNASSLASGFSFGFGLGSSKPASSEPPKNIFGGLHLRLKLHRFSLLKHRNLLLEVSSKQPLFLHSQLRVFLAVQLQQQQQQQHQRGVHLPHQLQLLEVCLARFQHLKNHHSALRQLLERHQLLDQLLHLVLQLLAVQVRLLVVLGVLALLQRLVQALDQYSVQLQLKSKISGNNCFKNFLILKIYFKFKVNQHLVRLHLAVLQRLAHLVKILLILKLALVHWHNKINKAHYSLRSETIKIPVASQALIG